MQVVGVLPNIQADDWSQSLRKRRILVGSRMNNEASVRLGTQPGPAAAKAFQRGVSELLLELIHGPKAPGDRDPELANRGPLIGSDHLPKKGVVHVAAGIVANARANRFRHRG